MSVSGISATLNSQAMTAQAAQAAQAAGPHRHNGRRVASLTDIDAQGSSMASPPSSTGKLGSRINIVA
jgi:hypothetical protein